MTKRTDLTIGKFYWVRITLDPDVADGDEWQNDTMPARYAGNDLWYTMGHDGVDDWPVVWIGDEIKQP